MRLLQSLYKIQSKSGQEKAIGTFIQTWITNKVPSAITKIDKKGNIYVTKGVSDTYPVVVAHQDQVQSPANIDVLLHKDIILGVVEGSPATAGLGADDKNGIWIALQCLVKIPKIKIALFVEEEVGCHGSRVADMSFFNDARFVIQCDRRGGYDFINTAAGTELCSKEFIEAANISAFGYKLCTGALTDVKTLKENGLKVSCCNLSCGYYSPHTDHEMTKISELKNCLAFVLHLCQTLTDVYPHEHKTYSVYTPASRNVANQPYYGAGLGSWFQDDIPFDDVDISPRKVRRKIDSKLFNEQSDAARTAIREELKSGRRLDYPLDFYLENKNLFTMLSYNHICKIFFAVKNEIAKTNNR